MISWISWEEHRRTKELCDYLEIEDTTFSSKQSRWLRHPRSIVKTIAYLIKHRPRTLIVQSPSIILALISVLLKPLLGYTLIVDAHNGAVKPDNPVTKKLYFLYRLVHRFADITIVTNEGLSNIILAHGGTPFVLPDRLFNPPPVEPKELLGKYNVAFVCSWDVDEPYDEVIKAFLDTKDTVLYVTGKAPQHVIEAYKHNTNIVFTGYTPLHDYLVLLRSVDSILAITTREDCILCAASEAVSFTQPLIISNTRFLKSYFSKGAVYTENNAQAIAAAYQHLLSQYERLKLEMMEFKPQLMETWEKQGQDFKRLVYSSPDEVKNYLKTVKT